MPADAEAAGVTGYQQMWNWLGKGCSCYIDDEFLQCAIKWAKKEMHKK